VIIGLNNHPATSHEDAGAAPAVATGPAFGQREASTLPTNATGKTYTPASLPADVSSLLAGNGPAVTPAPTPTASATSHAHAPTATSDSVRGTPSGKKETGGLGLDAKTHVPKSLLPLYSSPEKLLACARSVTPTVGALPIAVDFGRWSGPPFRHAPSVIFVFAGTTPATVRVVVIGPSCAGDAVRQFTQVTLPS
jgi:hypothetical protein